jgi:two-component system phosphate regulon sensor histidine kinase PhoR
VTVRSSIFRKLLLTSVLLIGVTLAIAAVLLTGYTADRERMAVQQHMAESLRLLAPSLIANPPADLRKWAEDADASLGARVTLIDNAGVVMADSRHDPESMENHGARPEVHAALGGQPGSAIRRSATLGVDFYYYAVPLDLAGQPRSVLRMAIPLSQVGASMAAVRMLILRASLLAAIAAMLIAYLMARSFTARIRRIEGYAKELVNEDYSGTLTAEGDDELGSVARSLRGVAEHFRRTMRALAQESSRREMILSSMVEGVLAVDRNLCITFYNEAFALAFQARSAAPEGLSMLHVVRDPALRALLTQVIDGHSPASQRMSLLNAGGRIFEVQAAPIDEQTGTGALATFHDVSELERLDRVRKDFVANISHELRTPLAAIQGFTETLLEGALDDPENNRKFLNIIHANTVRLADLASDLLTLSEIEAERAPVPAERLSAVELVKEALSMVGTEAQEYYVRTFLGTADDVHVCGQKGRLERAISNLLSNGIHYNHPGGEVRVDVRRVDTTVRISVSDTGIGIAAQDLPRIFERFYRADKARSRATGGTGLGLSIVRNIVERAGGFITVDSQPGKGSVFTLVLPAA